MLWNLILLSTGIYCANKIETNSSSKDVCNDASSYIHPQILSIAPLQILQKDIKSMTKQELIIFIRTQMEAAFDYLHQSLTLFTLKSKTNLSVLFCLRSNEKFDIKEIIASLQSNLSIVFQSYFTNMYGLFLYVSKMIEYSMSIINITEKNSIDTTFFNEIQSVENYIFNWIDIRLYKLYKMSINRDESVWLNEIHKPFIANPIDEVKQIFHDRCINFVNTVFNHLVNVYNDVKNLNDQVTKDKIDVYGINRYGQEFPILKKNLNIFNALITLKDEISYYTNNFTTLSQNLECIKLKVDSFSTENYNDLHNNVFCLEFNLTGYLNIHGPFKKFSKTCSNMCRFVSIFHTIECINRLYLYMQDKIPTLHIYFTEINVQYRYLKVNFDSFLSSYNSDETSIVLRKECNRMSNHIVRLQNLIIKTCKILDNINSRYQNIINNESKGTTSNSNDMIAEDDSARINLMYDTMLKIDLVLYEDYKFLMDFFAEISLLYNIISLHFNESNQCRARTYLKKNEENYIDKLENVLLDNKIDLILNVLEGNLLGLMCQNLNVFSYKFHKALKMFYCNDSICKLRLIQEFNNFKDNSISLLKHKFSEFKMQIIK
ncbi:hypothetical protein COBT_002717 [Conglomerata obtusa]